MENNSNINVTTKTTEEEYVQLKNYIKAGKEVLQKLDKVHREIEEERVIYIEKGQVFKALLEELEGIAHSYVQGLKKKFDGIAKNIKEKLEKAKKNLEILKTKSIKKIKKIQVTTSNLWNLFLFVSVYELAQCRSIPREPFEQIMREEFAFNLR